MFFEYLKRKKEERDRIERLERLQVRVAEAHRWLAEFDDQLEPMWDYILGKKITILVDKGRTLEIMAEGSVDAMREKLRKAFQVSDV